MAGAVLLLWQVPLPVNVELLLLLIAPAPAPPRNVPFAATVAAVAVMLKPKQLAALPPVMFPVRLAVQLPEIMSPTALLFTPPVMFPVWLRMPLPETLIAQLDVLVPPARLPTTASVPAVENNKEAALVLVVLLMLAVTVAVWPGARLVVVTQLVVVAPCTTPFAFVQVRLHPFNMEKVPPTVIPVPAALLIACTVRVSLIVTVNVLANATSPGPGTTPPTHVVGALKSPDCAARMSAMI
jgi:hypothetical protein